MTTKPKTISTKQYTKLLTDIKSLIETGINKSGEDATNQLTLTYWKIGERITKESLSTTSNYRISILKDLSGELELERTVLSRCNNFYQTYKSPPENKNLSWSHYRELIAIKDDKLRAELEAKAQAECWTRDKLIAAIKQKQNNYNSNTNQKPKIKRPTNSTYLYKAKVLEVIDGDTLILDIDLGFQVKKEQRVRLAAIDCPEITTKKGKEAFEYVRTKMTQTNFIMVQTHKIDIYGRYVAHIFYEPALTENKKNQDEIFKNGIYLNDELLRLGLAELF
jgi:endonuclease YncB( thermonuclease family)